MNAIWHGVLIEGWSSSGAEARAPHELTAAGRYLLVGAEGLEQLPAGAVTLPLVAGGFDASAHLMPHLIDFRSQSEAVQAHIVEALIDGDPDREVPYGALLEAPVDASSLHAHLCRQQRIVHGSEVAWLRLHDPYVAAHLPRTVGAGGLRRIMGPADRWHLRLGDQWLTLNRPPPQVGDAAKPPGDGASGSWDRLKRIGVVNRALALCGQLHRAGMLAHADHLDALVARAIDVRHIDDPQDQARYAQRGLQLDPRFDDHPTLAAALSAPDQVARSWMERLAALPVEVWDRVARECPREPGPAAAMGPTPAPPLTQGAQVH